MVYNSQEILKIQALHGGSGVTTIYKHIMESDIERMEMFANVSLEAGASIGYHHHSEESEIYHIIKGEGQFMDSDGSYVNVAPGDCCVIEKGQSHGMINTGGTTLEFIASVF